MVSRPSMDHCHVGLSVWGGLRRATRWFRGDGTNYHRALASSHSRALWRPSPPSSFQEVDGSGRESRRRARRGSVVLGTVGHGQHLAWSHLCALCHFAGCVRQGEPGRCGVRDSRRAPYAIRFGSEVDETGRPQAFRPPERFGTSTSLNPARGEILGCLPFKAYSRIFTH